MSQEQPGENWILHAYADGELDEAERVNVESRLAGDPAAREEIEAWKRQKKALHEAFDSVLSEPVPQNLLRLSRQGRNRSWSFMPAVAASLLALMLGAAAGYVAGQNSGWPRDTAFADSAILAHEVFAPEKRHAVEVAANESDHLAAWLSKRVGQTLAIPDLTSHGYTLLGGRLLAAADRPAAQFMYEDAGKRRITVFVAANPNGKETAFLITQKDGVTACYWLDGKLGFVVAGEQSREELMGIADVVYKAFDGA